ncbi:MAG: glycosyltransferase family 2 protein [Patescibacteria group bacterium]|nr:glycosyltransferase family 2 protein [Patescibacteria group bacterium]
MDVSIVIVSYNASGYLKECLDSIFQFTKNIKFEVIVVDNASSDDSLTVAKSYGKKVTVIANPDNRGFGAGVNTGIKKATGEYILVLNPDVRFLDDAISAMLTFMGQHSDVGLASCQFLDGLPAGRHGEQKMLANGGYFPTLPRLLCWAFFIRIPTAYHLRAKSSKLQATSYLDWVTGSFMFVRREVIDKVGLLDENIFMYGEEVEWQYRINSAGWRIGYTTTTKVIHHERGSQGGLPRGAILGEFKGLKYIYGKHFPGGKQIVVGAILDAAAFLRVIFWLARLKLAMAKIYLEALFL